MQLMALRELIKALPISGESDYLFGSSPQLLQAIQVCELLEAGSVGLASEIAIGLLPKLQEMLVEQTIENAKTDGVWIV